MSYTSIKNLKELINSKVLFYDLETTGLVKTKGSEYKPEEQYYNYKDNGIYDSARIVQIGWIYMDNFEYDYDIKPENISCKTIKPNNFIIPEKVISIHGITNEFANSNGISIKKGLLKLKKKILETEYIIGYNVFYDINILLNELKRLNMNKCINKILALKREEKILCIGQLCAQYAKPLDWIRSGYRVPAQTKVYNEIFKKNLSNAHHAKYDICASIEIMFWIYNNYL